MEVQEGRREGEGQSEQEVRREGEGQSEQDGRRNMMADEKVKHNHPVLINRRKGLWLDFDNTLLEEISEEEVSRREGEGQPEQDGRREGEGQPEQDGRREGEGEGQPGSYQKKKKGQPGNIVMLKQFSDYSKWIMVMISGTTMAYYLGRENITKHASSFHFLVSRILLFFTFVTDLALMLLISTSRVLGGSGERPHIAAAILVRTTGFLTMLVSASILLLLSPSYNMITMLSLVILMPIKNICTTLVSEVTDYEAHQPMLRQFFDVSAQVTAAAFGGMISSIFGHFKNLPKNVDQVDVRVFNFTEVFSFYTVIYGLLVMLQTTLPPSVPHPDSRLHCITSIRYQIHSLFGLLALIGLPLSAEFFGFFILLAIFPIFLTIGLPVESRTLWSQMDHESEPDTSTITITTFIFATLVTLYYLYFGSEHDFHLKTCIFFLFLAFLSSLSWMLPVEFIEILRMTEKRLTYSTIAWLIIAVLDLILLAIRSG